MVKFNPKPRTVAVGCLLLLAAAAAYLLRSDLTRVAASAPPSAVLAAPTCNVISGFVYQDLNSNGIRDIGEPPLPVASTMELRDNATNVLIATTTTDPASGLYKFDVNPNAPTTAPPIVQTVTFPVRSTNWSDTMTVPQFNPALGMLTSVKINNAASVTSIIRVENLAPIINTISATVGGTVTVNAPGVPALAASFSQPHPESPFVAPPFDGSDDKAGTSGKVFAPATASGNAMTTLTAPADLNLYTGAGSVNINASAAANLSTASDTAGNISLTVNSTATAAVTVTYEYMPSNCLAAGTYRIVQVSPEPPGFVDGCESVGNAKIPNSDTTDFIVVTLAGADLPGNNFGEVRDTDLAISKDDGLTQTTRGSVNQYTIVVRNNGPHPVTNATVTDTFPPSLTNVTWTCVGAGGGTCGAPNGTGNINTAVSLPVSATATFVVTATVSNMASGTISNTATVTTPPGIVDTMTGNNSATDTTNVIIETDLAITKTDGLTTIVY
jgi:uncharacterized repeat protein (TIGR01451 family)